MQRGLYLGAVCRNGRAAVRDGDGMHHLGARLVAPGQFSGVDFPDENRKGVNINLFGNGLVTQHLRRLVRWGACSVGNRGHVPDNVLVRRF